VALLPEKNAHVLKHFSVHDVPGVDGLDSQDIGYDSRLGDR
jgi:hypothetical protein